MNTRTHIRTHTGTRTLEMLIKKCRQAMMDDVQHGLAKYELGIKPGHNFPSLFVFHLEGCFDDDEMSQSLVQRKLNSNSGRKPLGSQEDTFWEIQRSHVVPLNVA